MHTRRGNDSRGLGRSLRADALLVMLLVMFSLNQSMAQSNTRQIVVPPQTSSAPRPLTSPPATDSLAASPAKWVTMAGSATAIGANARGALWIIGNTPVGRDHNVYHWTGRSWQPASATGVRVAVDAAGNAWVVQSSGAILHLTGTASERIAGEAMDIAAGANGAVWIVGLDQSISRGVAASAPAPKTPVANRGRPTPAPAPAQQYRWEKISGAAIRIAIDPAGNPWAVTSAGQVYHYSGNNWTIFPVSARDIAVGADGVVYVVSTAAAQGGFKVLRSQGASWVDDGIAAESIAAGAAGVVYAANSGNLLAERVPNRLTAGSPPVLPPASATNTSGQPRQIETPNHPIETHTGATNQGPPTQQASGGTGTQPPHNQIQTPDHPVETHTVRPIQPGAPAPSPSGPSQGTPTQQASEATPQTGGTAGGQQTHIQTPNHPPETHTAPAPPSNTSGPVPIPPQAVTVQVPPSGGPPPGAVVAPPGTITLPQGAITLNQPPPSSMGIPPGAVVAPGAPPGSGTSVTGGTLVTGAPPGVTPPASQPLTVTGLGYTPIAPTAGSVTLVPGAQYVYTPGKLLCSDPEAMGICKTVDAGYVGAYTLNTSCSNGFYDMIHGGTCWKCPDGDSNGSWIRSADSVDSGTACWRNATSSAVWDKYGMAWDCSGNQFWDSQDNNKKVNGSCWHCPDSYSTRSADPVWSGTACYSHQTSPASFLAYNGCPKADKTKMYPNDQRRPGEPFLDIASGISVANNAGGACWACPVSDEQGNYLYTERNANTLIGKQTGNGGCTVGFRYTPGKFVEPGLSGLPGVKDILAQEQVFQRPSALTAYLFAMATQRKLSGTQATQWVAGQWADIAAHPYQNDNVRALIYQYMLGHAPAYMYASGTPSSGAAEKKLVASFQVYIQARRTYVGQEALDMYYAWKQNVGVTRSLHAESELQTLFYYGTVPLDFSSIVAAVMVPTATGVGVLTAAWAGEAFQANLAATRFGTVARAMTLFRAFSSFDAFSELPLLAQIDIVSGPVGIAFAGATMAAIAIVQVVQIATAEQNLKSARDTAKNTTVDLFALYNGTDGADQVAMYWADATGVTTEHEDTQVIAAAQGAYAAAQKSNYASITQQQGTQDVGKLPPKAHPLPQDAGSQPPPAPPPAQQAATSQMYANFMNAAATLLQQLRRVSDGPSAKAGLTGIQNAMTTYNQTKARLPGANLGSDQQNAANSAQQQVNAEITRIKGIPAANQVLADALGSKYHGAD